MAAGNNVTNNGVDPYHSLVTSITEDELDRVRPYNSKRSIRRVPTGLRRGNEAAYTPMVVSIGPIHHGKESLRTMQQRKRRFLLDYLHRTNLSLSDCVRIVKEREERLRGCYEEAFDQLSSDAFVKIILLDAVFVVEVFLSSSPALSELRVEDERVENAQQVLHEIRLDLLLLENQLPFFIIEEIWNLATRAWVTLFCYQHFNHDIGLEVGGDDVDRLAKRIDSQIPEHFVDLVRKMYSPLEPGDGEIVETPHIPSPTELQRAGIKFKVKSSDSTIFNISFSNGILEIPKWKVNDNTESILRNLIAFEQCPYQSDGTYLCYYARLMNLLIQTPRDVDLLVDDGILENLLGDNKEMHRMISKTGYGAMLSPDNFYFADIFKDLNRHCSSSWNKWMATLTQEHFSTPWAIVSLVAGALLLILTFIQTVCSILSVRNAN